MAVVTLLYFARVREAIGVAEEQRELPDEIATVRDLMAWLSRMDARHAQAFAVPEKLRCAIDQVMTPLEALIGAAKEIAFFPPVTGG